MVRYDKVSEFVETLSGPSTVEGVPEWITKSLEIRQSRSSVDDLCKKVYELERDERRQQLLQVLENVGDVPRAMVGYDMREANSVDSIAREASELPRLAIVQDNQEDQSVLEEYNLLREEIMKKCRALEAAKKILDKSSGELSTIEGLLQSVADPEQFLQEYQAALDSEVKRI